MIELACCFLTVGVLMAIEHVASAIKDLADAVREQKKPPVDLKSCEPLRDWDHKIVDNGDGTQTVKATWTM